jgi:hypothetical protein
MRRWNMKKYTREEFIDLLWKHIGKVVGAGEVKKARSVK